MNRLPIDSIRVGGGRRPLGDVSALAASMEEIGLLNPVTVREDGDGWLLVAGLHRLEAARSIGWLEIEAVVVDLDGLEAELAEIDENLCRNDLTTLERAEQLARRKAIYEEMHPEAVKPKGGRPKNGETVSSFTEDTAEVSGITQRAVQHHVQIATAIPADVREAIRETPVADSTRELLTLARQQPETQRAVAERISTGAAPTVKKALETIRTEERHRKMAAPDLNESEALYPIIYADPPWPYDHSVPGEGGVDEQYPTMAVEDICALSIPATDNAVLFLWATAPKLPEAFRVMAAWGFAYKTCAVWDKQEPRIGYWFRGQHELLLVGVRGDVPPPLVPNRPPSILSAPREGHSRKPALFREMVEGMFPDLPRIELFARERHDGWACWGNENI